MKKDLRKEELLVGGFFFNKKEETPLVNSFLGVGSKEKTEKTNRIVDSNTAINHVVLP
jgi:hypothetical protein